MGVSNVNYIVFSTYCFSSGLDLESVFPLIFCDVVLIFRFLDM